MLLFAVVHVLRPARTRRWPSRTTPPEAAGSVLSATGTVEPQSGLVAVAAAVPGVVAEVLVRAGQQVKARDPLFRIDDAAARAALAVPRRARRRRPGWAGLPRRRVRTRCWPAPPASRAAGAALAASRAAHEQARSSTRNR